jgi:hypothetical protein
LSPCASPCRVSPWGLSVDALAQSIPDPPLGVSSLARVRGMGGGEGFFIPPGSRAPRPVSRGSPGTLAAHPFPAPPPPGFGQVELPDFASLLCCVSPALVEPSPGGSQAGTGPPVSSADPVSGVPLSHVSTQQAVPRDAVSTIPGWPPGASPLAFAGTPPSFRPSPGCFCPTG